MVEIRSKWLEETELACGYNKNDFTKYFTNRSVTEIFSYICSMRPQKVQDIEIMTSLVKTFRSRGYEGSSLAELAKSTGLKKASLYHRFPKGKEEMAIAVLNHTANIHLC